MLSTTNFSTVQTDYGAQGYAEVQNTLFVQQIAAVANQDGQAQDLLLGASSKLHLMVSNQKALDISANADGSTLIAANNSQAIQISPADVAKTVTLGSLSVSESTDTQYLSTTKTVGIEIQEDVKIDSSLIIGNDLVTGGDIFTKSSLNLLRNMDGQTNIGFGFRVSDASNLEVYKYNSQTNNTCTVAIFGQGNNTDNTSNNFPAFQNGFGTINVSTFQNTNSDGTSGNTVINESQFTSKGSSMTLPAQYSLGLGGNSNAGHTLDVIGDINFTGTLRTNGQPYASSQWSTGADGTISFSSNVYIGGSLVVTGSNVYNNVVLSKTLTESSNVVITNAGAGPALSVVQTQTTGQPVASFMAGTSTAIYINSNAYVAVGKRTATYPLDVAGTVACTGLIVNGVTFTEGGGGVNPFSTYNTSNVYLASSLGIGNSNPSYALDVAGDINISGTFRVNGTNFCDLVGNVATVQVSKLFSGSLATHSIVVDRNGKVLGWGPNSSGQLGNNSTTNSLVPLNVSTVSGSALSGKTIKSVACGTGWTTVADNQGVVYAWGANGYGQLGNNDSNSTANSNPINISTVSGSILQGKVITQVASGLNHTMAIDNQGTVYGWGSNGNLQIGVSSSTSVSNTPLNVSSGSSIESKVITQIACGSNFTVALDNQGQVYTWGNDQAIAIVSALVGTTIIAIACGSAHAMALDNQGNVYAWGDNSNGQLGNNATTNSANPVNITNVSGSMLNGISIKAISCGSSHSLALDNQGNVYAWGSNSYGQLGNGSSGASPLTLPIKCTISTGVTIIAVNGGADFSIALDNRGNVYTWGNNSTTGQLGNNSSSAVTTPASIMTYGAFATTTVLPLFANFTGQHRCFLEGISEESQHEYEGLIVCAKNNKYANLKIAGSRTDYFPNAFNHGADAISINEALPIVSLCDKALDKSCFGVLSMSKDNANPSTLDDIAALRNDHGDNRVQVNSLGEGAIWVCDVNGPIQSGNYITSSAVAGYGQRQIDDLLHNYTVAKITMTCDFEPPMVPMKEMSVDTEGKMVIVPRMTDPALEVYHAALAAWEVQPDMSSKPQYVPSPTENWVQETAPAYKMRYLKADGSQISKEEYDAAKASDLNALVYRAAFVGCTYHCG